MAKLSDIQILLLTTAASRDDGNVLPPPDLLGELSPAIRRAIGGLLRRGLIEEVAVGVSERLWRHAGEDQIGLAITEAGKEAIGLPPSEPEPVDPDPPAAPHPPTKIGSVLALLKRDQGVTLNEIVQATGWLPHTSRAALTGLRKKGHAIIRTSRGDTSSYRIFEAA